MEAEVEVADAAVDAVVEYLKGEAMAVIRIIVCLNSVSLNCVQKVN